MPRTASTDDPPRVYLDVMLGKLATILRMAGWDAAYALDRDVEADAAILEEADAEDRVIVTRDRQLAERASASVLLHRRVVDDQVAELRDAGFQIRFGSPSRCSACNGRLQPVTGDERTPDDVPDPDRASVWRCIDCGQHFWRGNHWEDVVERLDAEE